jgi:predicted HTH transcriptional regulator
VLSGTNLPADKSGILERLIVDRLITSAGSDRFHITNLGALLFARQLPYFEGLARKAVRVVKYKGTNRVETIREKLEQKGYAAGLEELIAFIADQLPRNEEIGQALRRDVAIYRPLSSLAE